MFGVLLFQLIAATGSSPEPPLPAFDPVQIIVTGRTVDARHGETQNVGFAVTDPIRTTRVVLSKMPGMCGFGIKAGGAFEPGALDGWLVDVTPVRTIENVMTFHVDWTRFGESGKASRENHASQLTLDAGASAPLDLIRLNPGVQQTLPPGCGTTAIALRIGVEYAVRPILDRRLFETELWLMDEMRPEPQAQQRVVQKLLLRGQLNVPTPFYFDDVAVDGGVCDISGEFTLRSMDGQLHLDLTSRRRFKDRESPNDVGEQYSELRWKIGDMAAIGLPKIATSPTATPTTLSISIRTKEIR